LIVEDDRDMAFVLQRNLECEGYAVRAVHDGAEGIRAGLEQWAHAIVLDLMLPRQNGFTVLKTLRGAAIDVPVLLLTARREDVDKLHGFRLGADDYVTKPFQIAELMARVRALIRRGAQSERGVRGGAGVLVAGPLSIEFATRSVRLNGSDVALSPKAFDLLAVLARERNTVVRRSDLLREVWGYADGVASRTLDAHINELRRKLEADPSAPELVKTMWRVGYSLSVSAVAKSG
jgi:two-component system, OmpR family, response regulator